MLTVRQFAARTLDSQTAAPISATHAFGPHTDAGNCNGYMVPTCDVAFDTDGVDGPELFTCGQYGLLNPRTGEAGRQFEGNPNRRTKYPYGTGGGKPNYVEADVDREE